jgi:catechol 2,3-dioxygenase-like lactoylglutathione lyase family enzyme
MEVNGIAHIFLTASNFETSRAFYLKLLPFLGMTPVIDTDTTFYCVGGRTAVGIRAPAPEHAGASFVQTRVGLHHLCFRARARRCRRPPRLSAVDRSDDHPSAARG